METINNPKDLLPVGKCVSLNGVDLFIQEKIGEGYTSMVFRGHLNDAATGTEVAIKAIKANRKKEDFSQEFLTLSSLQNELFESLKDFPHTSENEYLGYPIQISPLFYGAGNFENNSGYDVPYIVMEFIRGTSVAELLEKNSHLPEDQALVIAWQFFFLLHTLHQKMQKTYSDIKIENLIWQKPEEGKKGCLRVLDLGNLYDLKENAFFFGNPKADIYRATNIFLRILTGRSISGKPNEFVEDLPDLLQKSLISWGTKRFLRQNLHWREDERCDNTQRIVHSLSKLVQAWEMDETDLLNEASEKLARAEERQAIIENSENQPINHIPQAEDARNALGVIEARMSQKGLQLDRFTEDLIKRTDVILGWESHFNIGQEFLKGLSYENAREAFQKGLYHADEPARVRRYYYLASLAVDLKELFSEIRVPMYDVIGCMEKENYETAKRIIDSLDPSIQNRQYVSALSADCEMNIYLIRAREAERLGHYEQSAQAYEKAYQSLKILPDYESVQLQETGDIRAKYVEMLSMEETIGKALSELPEIDELYREGDVLAVVNKLHALWKRYPLLPELREYLIGLFQSEVQTHQFINAAEVAESATLMDDPQIWNEKLAVARTLAELDQHLQCGNFEQFMEMVVFLSQRYPEGELIHSVLYDLVNQYFPKRNVSEFPEEFLRDVDALRTFGLVDEDLLKNQVEAAYQAIDFVAESRKKLIDNYLATLEYIKQLDDLGLIIGRLMVHEALYMGQETNRLDKAEEIIANARQLSAILGDYRMEDIEEWRTLFKERRASVIGDGFPESQQEVWNRIKASYESFKAIYEEPPLETPSPGYYEFATLNGQKLLLDIANYQAKFAPEEPEVDRLFNDVADLMDHYKSGWLRIEEEAQFRTRSLRESTESVQYAFHSGQFNEAMLEIAELERQYLPEDVEPLHREINPRLVITKAYLDFISEKEEALQALDFSNASFLNQLREFANREFNGDYAIPRVYFTNQVKNYLHNYCKFIFNQMSTAELSFEEYENADLFAHYTVEYKKADSIIKVIQEENNGR